MLAPLLLLGAAAAAPIEIPFTRDATTGHLRMQTSIDGGPTTDFLFDTGSAFTVISSQAWKDAGHDPEKGFKKKAYGAGGQGGDVRVVGKFEVHVGGQSVELPAGLVTPMEEVAQVTGAGGILGLDLLKGHVAEVDFESGVMRLHDAKEDVPADLPWAKLSRGRGRLLYTRASIGTTVVDAVVDLGANTSILNSEAEQISGVAVIPDCGGTAMGFDGSPLSLHCVAAPLAVGGHPAETSKVQAGDIAVFHVLKLEDSPAMVLGLDVLARGHLWIDLGHKRMAWIPAS